MIIAGLSGSLRSGSFNTSLLNAAAALAPDGVKIRTLTIAGIPIYDGDLEIEAFPPSVAVLKDAIADADALLLVTPEYNNSIPGPLKNAVDWASRPSADAKRVFGGKPTALIGASPGRFGTILSQNAWLPVLRTLGCDAWNGGRLMASGAAALFGPDGQLQDEATAARLRRFLADFCAFAAAPREAAASVA